MKSIYTLLLISLCTVFSFAQKDEYDTYEEEEYEDLPLNTFFRVTTNVFTINSIPSSLELNLMDDDFGFVESTLESGNLQTYGIGVELAHLFGNNYVWSFNNHVGWADFGRFFTYLVQAGIGKEFEVGRFYIDPMLSLGYTFSSQRIARFDELPNGYFLLNGSFIIDNMVTKFKSRGFHISPSISLDFPITEVLSLYMKGGIYYTFGRESFIRVTGETDEIDEDGNNISTYERVNFIDNRLEFRINNQLITSSQSPFIHYNLNNALIQIGATFLFSSDSAY